MTITLIRDTSMPSARFETENPASERPYSQALDRVATWIDSYMQGWVKCKIFLFLNVLVRYTQ